MKNKIILGVEGTLFNARLLEKDFILIEPDVRIENNEVKTNFDFYLCMDSEPNRKLRGIIGQGMVEHFGTNRFSKPIQSLILKKLNIPTPKIYASVISKKDHCQGLDQVVLQSLDDDVEVLVKSNNGAKGLGQAIITRQKIFDLYEEIGGSYNETKLESINENYRPGGDESKNNEYKSYFYDTIRGHDYHFAELKNKDEEYRIIALYGSDPIIIQRKVSKQHWQSNSAITNEGIFIKKHPKVKEFKQISDKLLSHLKTPWLSIDVYISDKGEIGVFEFQMEFGFKKVPKKLLVDSINNAVHNYIKKELL